MFMLGVARFSMLNRFENASSKRARDRPTAANDLPSVGGRIGYVAVADLIGTVAR